SKHRSRFQTKGPPSGREFARKRDRQKSITGIPSTASNKQIRHCWYQTSVAPGCRRYLTKTPSLTPEPFPLPPPRAGSAAIKHKAFLAAGVFVKGSRTTQAGILSEVGPYKIGNGDLQITDLGAGPLLSGAIRLSHH